MNLSGIVVAVAPDKFNEGIVALNAINSIEIHQTNASSGQIVVVQEAENVSKEIEALKRIKALPMVTYAEMVFHYVAEDVTSNVIPPDDLDSSNLDETLKKLNS